MTSTAKTIVVRVGFAVGSGDPVEVPLAHTFVTGQTQLSGKTTTLHALVERSGQSAIAFVTKRGEQFAGRPIAPYLPREIAGGIPWRLVETILASTLGERKLKYERLWIINAAKSARSLQDVADNVDRLMGAAQGSRSVEAYTLIREYLNLVLPEMRALDATDRLVLGPGLNVMNLVDHSTQLQALVIRATLAQINAVCEHTLVVFPEAWEFAPRGRQAPAKDEAIAMIRKGAGIGNYLLCDSQDLAGVDTVIRQGCSVWILGVQRELNELRRTLQMIPHGIKRPRAEDVAALEIGQFYVCYGTRAIRTYVQPSWLPADLARQVARGELDVLNARSIASAGAVARAARDVLGVTAARRRRGKDDEVTNAEAEQLRTEIAALKDENRRWRETHATITKENDDMRRRMATLEKGGHDETRTGAAAAVRAARQSPARADRAEHPDDAAAARVRSDTAAGETGAGARLDVVSEPAYQAIKARLIAEAPQVLRVLVEQPAIDVEIARVTITVDGLSLKGRLARLIADRWFDEPRTQGTTRKELARTGSDVNTGTLSRAFAELVRDGFLTVEHGDRYQAVAGMKVNIRHT